MVLGRIQLRDHERRRHYQPEHRRPRFHGPAVYRKSLGIDGERRRYDFGDRQRRAALRVEMKKV